ncbi:MAG TPA: CARDB domain-containing protein, partial [Thermoanaerobaculia bacterium]|nr:CARDB domain-containing protein [Thermoanaerobaculia bacterium]
GLTLTDSLPVEVTFTNFTTTNGWTCSEASGTITCHDNGTGMEVGQSAQVTILASVDTDAAIPISNTASATPALADCGDPSQCEAETAAHLANNTATALTGIGSSGFDLAIASITDNPDPVAPGQGLKYTVVAVNGGTTEAANVVIRIVRPSAGVHFDNADGSNGFNCSDSVIPGATDCVGTLPAGGDTTITVNFTTLTAALPPDVTLSATIDPDDLFAETNEGNNTQSEVTTRSGATCSACVDLVASQLTVDPEIAFSGDTLTVTFQVVNIGDMATALVPGQILAGLAVISDGTVSSAAASSSDSAVTCGVTLSSSNIVLNECQGNLAPSQGVTITFTTTVTGTYVEVYGVADPYDAIPAEFNETNNVATQSVVLF